jgi:nitrogen regulatory protein P-II 1
VKKITVIVPPAKFDSLKKKLTETGVTGVTVSNVEGFGFQKRGINVLEGKEVIIELLPKIKIEIIVPDSGVEKITAAVIEAARTGRIGDGKIFISDVADVIRIRTGERGENAV